MEIESPIERVFALNFIIACTIWFISNHGFSMYSIKRTEKETIEYKELLNLYIISSFIAWMFIRYM